MALFPFVETTPTLGILTRDQSPKVESLVPLNLSYAEKPQRGPRRVFQGFLTAMQFCTPFAFSYVLLILQMSWTG